MLHRWSWARVCDLAWLHHAGTAYETAARTCHIAEASAGLLTTCIVGVSPSGGLIVLLKRSLCKLGGFVHPLQHNKQV